MEEKLKEINNNENKVDKKDFDTLKEEHEDIKQNYEKLIITKNELEEENKKKYFNHCLKKLPCEKKTIIEIQVRRNGSQLFNDSFEALYKKDAKILRGKLVVYFENEEAVDEGGKKKKK